MSLEDIKHAIRHPPKPCPISGLAMDLVQDEDFPDIVEHYHLIIYRDQFNSPKYLDIQRIAFGEWMNKVMMPYLNQYGYVTLGVEDYAPVQR